MQTTKRVLPTLGIAAACLVLGSTGGAVAGGLVTGADIKDGTVRAADLHNGDVGTFDLANDGVFKVDLSPAVTGRLGKVAGYRLRMVTGDDVAAGEQGTFAVSCPEGKVVVGTSGYWLKATAAPQVYQADADTAAILSTNRSGETDSLTLIVACADSVETGARTARRGPEGDPLVKTGH